MNYLEIALIAVTAVFLVGGLAFGFMRGFSRSVLRAVIVAAAIVAALCVRETVADTLLSYEVNGATVQEHILSSIPENFSAFASILLPVVQIVVSIVCFVGTLVALQIVSMLVFALLKIIVRPKLFGHRWRLLGAVVGLVQGAALAFFICVPVVGLVSDAGVLAETEYQGEKVLVLPESLDIRTFEESDVYKIYDMVGADFYASVSTGKDGEGKVRSLGSQVEGFSATIRLADSVTTIGNLDFSDGRLTAERAETIKDTLSALSDLKDELAKNDPDALDVVDELIGATAESLGLTVDLSDFSVKDVDFEKEGAFLDDLVAFEETGTLPDVGETVRKLSESTVVLPVLEQSGVRAELTEAQKADAEKALEGVEDEKRAEMIRKVLGLSSSEE